MYYDPTTNQITQISYGSDSGGRYKHQYVSHTLIDDTPYIVNFNAYDWEETLCFTGALHLTLVDARFIIEAYSCEIC